MLTTKIVLLQIDQTDIVELQNCHCHSDAFQNYADLIVTKFRAILISEKSKLNPNIVDHKIARSDWITVTLEDMSS